MADYNEALHLGSFSAKDVQISQSARSRKLGFHNENVGNKQAFANAYDHSLRKRTQATENQVNRNNPPKHSSKRPDQAPSLKNNRSKQPHSSATIPAKNGRYLPQSPNEGAARQENTVRRAAEVADRDGKNRVIENRFDKTKHQCDESAEYSIAGTVFGLNQQANTQAIVSENIGAYQNGFGAMAATASGVENLSGVTSTVSSLPPNDIIALGQAAQPQTSLQNNDALLHSAVEENSIKTPITNAVRPAIELNKNNLATAEAYSSLHVGQGKQEADVDTQQSVRQESALYRDRLLSLVQQNGTQSSNTSVNDLNKLLAQQTIKLSPAVDDQTSNDFNVNAIKDPGVTPRLSGNPLHILSPMLQMSSPLDHKGWSNEVGQRVMWMVNTDLQQAQLQLNPKHLGPIEIKITLTADQQVNVHFLTHSTTVKEALDQALPRLREVFDQSGLNLNDVNVQQESHKQHRDHHHTAGNGSIGQSHLAENMHEEVPVAQIFRNHTLSSNIVDFYA